MICNYGSHLPDGMAESMIKFANASGLAVPKIVIDSAKILPRQIRPRMPYFRVNQKKQAQSIFYKNLQNAQDIATAIQSGAQILFTQNMAYSSLIVGACRAHFDWSEMDHNQLANASIIADLLESDVQAEYFSQKGENKESSAEVTSNTLAIAQFSDDGSCVISKTDLPPGFLNHLIVKKLYEIEEPKTLITEEIVVNICKLVAEDLGENHVRIRGATGQSLKALEPLNPIRM
jgi:hypothetical protein